MQKQKGFTQAPKTGAGFIPIILLVIALFGAVAIGTYYYYFANRQSATIPVNTSITLEFQADYQQAAKNVPSVKNVGDLNAVSADLDSTDITQIDKELNGLSADSSSF